VYVEPSASYRRQSAEEQGRHDGERLAFGPLVFCAARIKSGDGSSQTRMAMRYDGVIFDLDGTLVDTLEDVGDAMNRVLSREQAPGHGYAAYKLMVGKGIRDLVGQALPPEKRSAETIARCHEAMIADYGEHCLVKTREYDGVSDLVSGLRATGVKLAVLSNKADELTRRIVESLFGAGGFDVVVGARPGLPLKPDPTVALSISTRLGVVPRRIVFLGDSGIDMLTAVAAGMIAVGAAWGFRTKEELVENGARAVLDRPLELLGL
jgi:phosphoglycolate phosphatase